MRIYEQPGKFSWAGGWLMNLGSWVFPLLRVPGAAPGEKDKQCQHTAEQGRDKQPWELGMAALPPFAGSAPLGEPLGSASLHIPGGDGSRKEQLRGAPHICLAMPGEQAEF